MEDARNGRRANRETERNIDRDLAILVGRQALLVMFEACRFLGRGLEDFDIADFAFFRHLASFPLLEAEA